MMNQFNFKPLAITALAAFSLNVAPVFAADAIDAPVQAALPVAKALSGNKKDEGWYNLTQTARDVVVNGSTHTIAGNPSFGGFPGFTPWAAGGIKSQVPSDNDASAYLTKTANGASGGAYPASSGLYNGGFSGDFNVKGATIGVFETKPVADLSNVVFQVELGAANAYDFYLPNSPTGAGVSATPVPGTVPFGNANNLAIGALTNYSSYAPTLNITYGASNTAVSLVANFAELSAKSQNGTITMPTGQEPLYINLYAFQWDLSGYDNISAFNVSFTAVQHASVYAARLTQSDTFNQVVAVPEPESYALLLAGLGVIGFVARRRSQA